MKRVLYLLVFLNALCLTNCEAQPEPTVFPEEALQDMFINLEGESLNLKSILEQHKGKKIVIDVWASWCRDCIVGLPNLKALQEEFEDVVYVFLSMDKTQKSWKKSIDKYNLVGDHYFMAKGWKSQFSEAIDLDWVPRYMVIDAEGNILVFKAIKANDPKLKEHLK